LLQILSKKRYINAPEQSLENAFEASFRSGHGKFLKSDDFIIFSRENSTCPSTEKAEAILDVMNLASQLKYRYRHRKKFMQEVFRKDIWAEAVSGASSDSYECSEILNRSPNSLGISDMTSPSVKRSTICPLRTDLNDSFTNHF
jgi:predicted ATPase